jgi:flagellar hook-associated protein 1 FlgK
MASIFGILSVARDGILAQTAAIDLTGQNVAGANTPGYVKRTATLESRPNGGVQMSGAARSFDRFTYAQLVDQSGKLASATARSTAMSDVEVLVTPSQDHLGDRADALLNTFHELALHPADTSVRTSVLAQAQWVASGFSETANGLESLRSEFTIRATDVASEVNQRLTSLTKIDQDIVSAKGRGEDASDLLDRRDQLVREIGDRVGARSVESDTGSITIFGAGTVLYEGGRAAQLVVSQDPGGMLRVEADRNGNLIDVTNGMGSGTLEGIIQARDVDIPSVMSSLDKFAKDFADAVNALHVTGFALDGTTGRPLFVPAASVTGAAHAMAVDPSMTDHPELLAAASNANDLPGGNDIATALANLSTTALPNGSTASERYAAIASKVGVLRSIATSEEQMRQDTVATATTLRESASGVSTDEEMIHMQQFQRAFEASSKVLQTVDGLFDVLLRSFGG